MTQPLRPHADVRMRGFTDRVSVDQAWRWVDGRCAPLDTEAVSLAEGCGRILAAAAISPIDVPSFHRSAMDGYAVRGAETEGAGDYNPLSFQLSGECLPGEAFPGEVLPGHAVRIMTGAPLPNATDAVVPAEFAVESAGRVDITAAVPPGKHVGRMGEDVRRGDTLLMAGRRLRPQDLGLLASVGIAGVDVIRRPRVRLLITGNELVQPGQPRGPHQIYDANSAMLKALIERDGAILSETVRCFDDAPAIRSVLLQPSADVIVVSGGSSVGAEDHAPSLLAELGELAVHGIAMRPSSPTGMGAIGKTVVFLLPGNPVSCLCAYDFFARRALRLLGGHRPDWPYHRQRVPVARKIVSAVGRVDYCRVRMTEEGLVPLSISGASILSSTTRADGFVIVPADCEGYPPQSEVLVYFYD